MKLTKRKAFNFLRSYFDVFNKLQTDKDKLAFISAIINKQFLNEDPKDLKFPVDLAYDSQINAIDSSVKGWLRVKKTDLQGNKVDTPPTPPTTPPKGKTNSNPKEEEVEEKEKEEVKEDKVNPTLKFLDWFNNQKLKHLGVMGKFKTLTDLDVRNLNKLKKEYVHEDFNKAFKAMKSNKWAKENNMIIPSHFLRNDNFVKYLNSKDAGLDKPLSKDDEIRERLKL